MIDSIRPVRRALLALMKADDQLIALVPAASIHGQNVPSLPTRPFILIGSMSAAPLRGACMVGQSITGSVHAYARGRWEGDRLVEYGEDRIERIGEQLARLLDCRREPIPEGSARIMAGTSRVLVEDEPDSFHYVLNLTIRCLLG